MKDTLEEKMHASRPEQSVPAREAMFARVLEQVPGVTRVPAKIVSPYTVWFHMRSKAFVGGVLGVCLLVGTGGTVAVAEAAKPGDVLFPVDQATEAMRLLLASDAQRTELQSAFLDERQQELTQIIAEEIAKTEKAITDSTSGVPVNEQGEARITRAVDAFLRQAEQLPKSDTEGRRRAVISLIDEVRVSRQEGDAVRLRIDEDRFEIRTDDMRIRSRDDGEGEVRFADSDDSQRGEDGHRSDDDHTDRRFDDGTGGTDNSRSGDDDSRDEAEDDHRGGSSSDDTTYQYDDSGNRGEDHSGKDDSKDEDKDEDKTEDNSGKSDND